MCDEVPPDKKGEVYERIWKMLHDIQAAQDAGMEADDMIKFLADVLSKAYFAGQPKES